MRIGQVGTVAGALCALVPGAVAQVQNPTGDDFHRRALGACAILGDYLYIEGGLVSQKGDSSSKNGVFARPFNRTLSLPLNTAWTGGSVPMKEIDRGSKAPIKFNSLWADEHNNVLIQFDGEGPKEDPQGAEERNVWTLEVDGEGGGKWTTNNETRTSAMDEGIYRKAQVASAVCNGTAFALGGFKSAYTDSRLEDVGKGNEPDGEMQSFNMVDGIWRRSSLDAMSPPNGVFIRGIATCVEGIGANPYLFTSGGAISSRVTIREGVRSLDPTNITFYDIKSDKWLWQKATGDPPAAGRWQHCMVGVKSPSGSYELFVYGGYNDEKAALDDVWVLTLPGFHWIRMASSKTPRAYHSCVVAGKRQMIVVGGIIGSSGEAWAWDEKDDLGNGIGVFDLTKGQWKDGYDPDAGEYQSPDVVQEWYKDGGMDQVEWSTNDVQAIFGAVKVNLESSTSSNSTDKENDSQGTSNESEGSSPPAGAIAGGVVGGVAALGLLATAIFCFLRRRRRHSGNQYEKPGAVEAEARSPQHVTSKSGSQGYTNSPSSELQGSQVGPGPGPYYEMPAVNQEASELDASGYPGFVKKG